MNQIPVLNSNMCAHQTTPMGLSLRGSTGRRFVGKSSLTHLSLTFCASWRPFRISLSYSQASCCVALSFSLPFVNLKPHFPCLPQPRRHFLYFSFLFSVGLSSLASSFPPLPHQLMEAWSGAQQTMGPLLGPRDSAGLHLSPVPLEDGQRQLPTLVCQMSPILLCSRK